MPLSERTTGPVVAADANGRPTAAVGRERVSVSSVLALLETLLDGDGPGGRGVAGLLAAEDLNPGVVAVLEDRLLQVRDSIGRLRRREHELSALFSSARELAELREPDQLLRKLVQRAHELVGTDITYVASFDPPTGDLLVRETVGAVTPALLDVRVPAGKGLATKVAMSRAAYWSSRYSEDSALDHDPVVDDVVSGEGIVSMAGVPMLAGEETVGVLVAAHRSEKTFTTDEIALLSAFADHASVVLQTVRLLEEAVSSAAEAEQACAELTRHTTSMERTAAVHVELTAAVLRGGNAEDVAVILGGVLRRLVTITDRHGTRYAGTGGAEAGRYGLRELAPEVRAAVEESRRTGLCVPVAGAGGAAAAGPYALAVAVMAGETPLGAVLVGPGELELTAPDHRTVERASQIVALLTLRQEAVADAEERVRGELVSDVLSARSVYRHELLLRARSRGIRIDELKTPVVVTVAAEFRRRALRAANDVAPTALAGEHDGTLAVLLASEPADAADAVHARVGQVVPGPVLAVAGPTGGVETLAERFDLARRCARLLAALGRDDAAATTDGFAPYMALFGSGREDLTAFIDHTLGPVAKWDAERGTELMVTLHGFVEANASPTRTARNLGLHTNTVLQRLDRITALLGDTWRDPEPLFRTSVAVRLHRLAADL